MSIDRIRALPCWQEPISAELLKGGLSNESWKVTDRAGVHVVRFGVDFPFHHVFRDREVMAARAAHAAGFAPEVRYSEPGVMVSAFLGARTWTEADMQDAPAQIGNLLRDFHRAMPAEVSGPGAMFWVFHVIRDYARTLAAHGSRFAAQLPRFVALAHTLEAAQVPLPIVFGHHDLLPGNFLDDGQRLWLIDFEYAGFDTAMFDLAGAASNAGMGQDEAMALLAEYLGHAPDAAFLRAHAAMGCASLLREATWSMVSELHLAAPGVDYSAYTAENLVRLDRALERYRITYGNPAS